MNVIFLSPNYPSQQYLYCAALKEYGINVLGIGDCRFEHLSPACQNSLTEYRYITSLDDYDKVYRSVAYFVYKYGRIDYIDSQNEYWLPLEARLRRDFNFQTGLMPEDMDKIRRKSVMKQYFAKAGVKTARFQPVSTLEAGEAFAEQVGYPLIAKPDIGSGSVDARKIENPQQLAEFYAQRPYNKEYILEEFLPGHVVTFEGITDRDGHLLFGASQTMAVAPLEALHGSGENISYTQNPQGSLVPEIGQKVVQAFEPKTRFFDIEFIRLNEDKEGAGKRGEYFGMEVNMRAPGGAVPDKINYAYNVDVHKIWAEVLRFNQNRTFARHNFTRYVVQFEQSNRIEYRYRPEDIRLLMSENLLQETRLPRGGVGFILQAEDVDQMRTQAGIILQHEDGSCLVK